MPNFQTFETDCVEFSNTIRVSPHSSTTADNSQLPNFVLRRYARPRGLLPKTANFQTLERDCVEFSNTILPSHLGQTKPDHARLSDFCFSCCFQQPRTGILFFFRTRLPVATSSYLQHQTLPSFAGRHQVKPYGILSSTAFCNRCVIISAKLTRGGSFCTN